MNGKTDRSAAITKQAAIASALRHSVVAGELRPGARFLIRTEIEARFGVSRMTVQKALDTLARDGFVRARGRLGTFVTDYPPCLCRYGIVFGSRPQWPGWCGYYDALQRVGHEFGEAPGHEVAFYYGVAHEGDGDYAALLQDIQSERLAGILFAAGPWNLQKSLVIQQQRVPCVAVMSPQHAANMPHFATLYFDGDSLFEKAIRTLVERGCRRPAVLIGKGYDRQLAHLRQALRAHDLTYDPVLLQGVDPDHVELAEHVTTLWMRLTEREQPDGLFVADDNLVEWACSGLRHAGIRPGVDLPVAAHCNFPARVGGPMPLDRVGYDIRALVRKFIEITDARRRGQPFERVTPLPAVHEENCTPIPLLQPASEDYVLAGLAPAS